MEQHIKVATIDAGYRKVIKFLMDKYNYQVKDIIPINSNRYIIVLGMNGDNYLICFKRDFFNSFGKMFREQGARGVGETINCRDIQTSIQRNVKCIYFVYTNGSIYKIDMQDFLTDSIKWVNNENKEVRSIDLHRLMRVNT